MDEYRCYLLDRGGTIRGVRTYSAPDDEVALQEAREILRGLPQYPAAELWELARKVGAVGRREPVRAAVG
jgi:hypothetical protein